MKNLFGFFISFWTVSNTEWLLNENAIVPNAIKKWLGTIGSILPRSLESIFGIARRLSTNIIKQAIKVPIEAINATWAKSFGDPNQVNGVDIMAKIGIKKQKLIFHLRKLVNIPLIKVPAKTVKTTDTPKRIISMYIAIKYLPGFPKHFSAIIG